MDSLARLNEIMLPFAKLLGIRFVSASPESGMCAKTCVPSPPVLHGGAMMAFADTLGACATVLNLREGFSTTTLESKTNFLAAAPVGSTVRGECTPLHRGRRSMVWQTRISGDGGRLLGIVIQTQMVLEPRPA
jgi:uncharacterized protein (TIGR00369 family)